MDEEGEKEMTGHGDWMCREGERPHTSNLSSSNQRKPKDRSDCFMKKNVVSE